MKLIESIMTNTPCYKQGRRITVKGLMLHSVGCPQPSASVFIKNWNRAEHDSSCVHGFIDGNDGTVYQTLPWDYRGWHAGGSANNTHIGVEMCEPACIKYTHSATFTCSDMAKAQEVAKRTYESAVELFAMLCKQYGLDPMTDIISHSEGHTKGVASAHADPEHLWRQLALPYTMATFRSAVKNAMGSSKSDYAPTALSESDIYAFFKSQGLTDQGVAGLMGNLYAESGLKSTNLQNSYEKSLGMDDATYTAAVDSSAYGNFITDKAGYGLAQWTYWSRKQALLNFAVQKGTSIGDCKMQCEFLMEELKKNYPTALAVLKSATSVRQASDAVLLSYEKPADQGEAVRAKRTSFGQTFYDKYAVSSAPTVSADVPYRVKIDITNLNIRKGPGKEYDKTGRCTGRGIFTIVEEKDGWGKLKSGAGWICLSYTERI